jgi:hypothetical protein
MGDEELITIFGQFDPEGASDEERQAYEKGYGDYQASRGAQAVSILREPYDPPAGQEKAYGAGWEKARKEDDDRRDEEIIPIISAL